MGKQEKKKPSKKAPGASGKPAPRGGGWTRHLGLVLVAVLVQALLALGYLTFFDGSGHHAAEDGPQAVVADKSPARLPAANCPADWADCPRVAGIDWVSVEAEAPSVEGGLEGCDAGALLSTQRQAQPLTQSPKPPSPSATRTSARPSSDPALDATLLVSPSHQLHRSTTVLAHQSQR